MNHVSLVGTVGQYGVKIAWTEAGKPQTSFTLITEEPGPDSAYKTFILVMVFGGKAPDCAETLEPGDVIAIEHGKLSYKAGKTKDSGKLVVVTFNVERLSASLALPVESAN
jgi:single-stranded DNA-binding protein